MGLSFRKSIKIDSGKINLSKSGVGFSTGVKGARVGINSRGRLYSSVGSHGVYYRKTYGSKKRQSSSGLGSLIFLGIIIIIFVKIFRYISENPKILLIPGSLLFLYLVYKISLFIFHKRTENFIRKVSKAINEKNIDLLSEIIRKIHRTRKIVYEVTYYQFLMNFLSVKDAQEEVTFVFNRYRKFLNLDRTEAEDEKFIYDLLRDTYLKSDFTTYDANHILTLCNYLSLPKDLIEDIKIELAIIQKVFDIRKNGLNQLETESPIAVNKQCYYEGIIQILKSRINEGHLYYEDDKEGTILITNDGINLIYDGHKKIRFSEILKLEIVDDVLRITVVNRQKPLGFYSREQKLILEIINQIMKNS